MIGNALFFSGLLLLYINCEEQITIQLVAVSDSESRLLKCNRIFYDCVIISDEEDEMVNYGDEK